MPTTRRQASEGASRHSGRQPAPPAPAPQNLAYRLSTRGQRASRAAKANAASKRFATRDAAEQGRAHPGDHARVVTIDISPTQWDAWFGGGMDTIDLRRA
jgi:hypothetical protein